MFPLRSKLALKSQNQPQKRLLGTSGPANELNNQAERQSDAETDLI